MALLSDPQLESSIDDCEIYYQLLATLRVGISSPGYFKLFRLVNL